MSHVVTCSHFWEEVVPTPKDLPLYLLCTWILMLFLFVYKSARKHWPAPEALENLSWHAPGQCQYFKHA